MNSKMKKSYAEVRAILDLLGNTYKEKVPEKLLNLFYSDSEYIVKFDSSIPIEELSISREALVMISILNLKYWEEDPEQIKKLQEMYEKNERDFQDSFSASHFNNEQVVDKKIEVHKEEMIVFEKENLFSKIKKCICKLFQR